MAHKTPENVATLSAFPSSESNGQLHILGSQGRALLCLQGHSSLLAWLSLCSEGSGVRDSKCSMTGLDLKDGIIL